MTRSENKQGTLATLAGAAGDFVREWRTLAGIEVFVVLVSFVVITPMSEALLRMLVSRSTTNHTHVINPIYPNPLLDTLHRS